MEPINITRRNLFGIRLNHDQLKQDLNELCREQLDSQKQRWNFDFETLKPINQEQQRFDWNAQSVKPIHYNKVEICLTTFNDLDDEYEHHEEDDDCLAMPAFYQLQRIQKMKQTEFNLKKFMQLATVQQNEPLKKQSKKKVRNTKKRSSNSKLIITFSENRKDTLRSSRLANSNSNNDNNNENKLKQPTILNSFQRKKKNVDSSNASNSSKKN